MSSNVTPSPPAIALSKPTLACPRARCSCAPSPTPSRRSSPPASAAAPAAPSSPHPPKSSPASPPPKPSSSPTPAAMTTSTARFPAAPTSAYNELYAALQQWGYFQLVDSPAHADLIFQIRGTELAPSLVPTPDASTSSPSNISPHLVLTILDPARPRHSPSTPSPPPPVAAPTSPKAPSPSPAPSSGSPTRSAPASPHPVPTPAKLISRDTLRPSFETLIQFTAPRPPASPQRQNPLPRQ